MLVNYVDEKIANNFSMLLLLLLLSSLILPCSPHFDGFDVRMAYSMYVVRFTVSVDIIDAMK